MRGGRGGRVASLDVSMRRQKQEVVDVWLRAPATRSASFWREDNNDWQSQYAGPSQVAGPAQVRPGWASLSLYLFLFVSVFLINCNCWDLNKILKRFQKS